uniref:Partial AB-hydrolase lipase domain-containing protein n=1 Tax=Megaselia scalaris TaxID=36166 RepID=T1GX16_MEGSC
MQASTTHILIVLFLRTISIDGTTYNRAEYKIIEDGFPLEIHNITTDDGYILKAHRIPNPGRPVMLLNHGFVASSDAFLWLGKNHALPYQAFEANFDVWMLNCRGNWYSSQHKKISSLHPKFWKFSIHEIGMYDLPAAFDYILKTTNRTKLHYVGHSQGTAVFLIFQSERQSIINLWPQLIF